MRASIAHNLLRWVAALGIGVSGPLVVKTVRRKFIALLGRHHHFRSTSPPSPAEKVALGHAVESVLCASRETPDLIVSTLRSPADHPATSSAHKMHTSSKEWVYTFARQAITEGAATTMISRLTTAENHQLRGLDGEVGRWFN